MKLLLFILLFSFTINFSGFAQNLVPNPSFELETTNEKKYKLAEDWETLCAAALRYGPNINDNFFTDNPIIKAHSGKSYIGIGIKSREDKFRCFPKVRLKQTLKKDEIYRIGFYLVLDKLSGFAVKNMGINLTNEEINCDSILNISTPTLEYLSENQLNDSLNWMLISFSYKAKGNENHLTIGNFKKDTNHLDIPDSLLSDKKNLGYSLRPYGIRFQGAYYFIDDVFVISEKDFYSDISKAPIKKGETITLNNILFATNKSELLPTSFTELDKLSEIMKGNPTLIIVIRGHTDNVGIEEHNQQLSLDRAKTVMNYLVEKGIASNRLSTWGFGSSRPLASNVTEEGRAMNRRVEILAK